MANKKNGATDEFEDVPDSKPVFWKDYSEGDFITGTYLGAKQETGLDGNDFLSHRIEQDDDVIVGVSGSTLDDRLAKVPVGARVKVTFTGMQTSGKNRKMKMFAVQVAKGTNLRTAVEAASTGG